MSESVKYLTPAEVAASPIWGDTLKALAVRYPQLKFTLEFIEVPLTVPVPTSNGEVTFIRVRRTKAKDNHLLGIEPGLKNAEAIAIQDKVVKALALAPPEVIDEVDQFDNALLSLVVSGFLARAQLNGTLL